MRKSAKLLITLSTLALLLSACADTKAEPTKETNLDSAAAIQTQNPSMATESVPAPEQATEATTEVVNTTEAQQEPVVAPDPAKEVVRPASWTGAISKGKVGFLIPDLTVSTASGGSFTLTEALKDHELVLINLWATWCPPCNMEFPYLEEAYQAYQDRVEVIALSTDPNDTLEVMKEFAETKQLSFQMAQDENNNLIKCFSIDGIPTSILVDRNGKVVWMEVGAMPSAEAFTEVFDQFLQEGGMDAPYGEVAYRVTIKDQNGDPVPGAVVNFCSDESCQPTTTDENGVSLFVAEFAEYHVQVLSLPDGYNGEDLEKISIGPWSGNTTLTVTKQG